VDAQHRDLVAAGVDGDQEPAVGRELQGALVGQPLAGPGASGRERGPGTGVSEPSACRLNAPIVFVPLVLSLT
jgi:hypothetical protein